MMQSIEFLRLLVILVDVLGSTLKGVVCHCLPLGLFFLAMFFTNERRFFLSRTNYFKSFTESPVITRLALLFLIESMHVLVSISNFEYYMNNSHGVGLWKATTHAHLGKRLAAQ